MKTTMILLSLVIGLSCTHYAEELSDAAIKKILIERSISAYSGACPCPYNVMRNGRRCGGNSAYSKPGGAEPLCYDKDVTDEMIDRYRARQKK